MIRAGLALSLVLLAMGGCEDRSKGIDEVLPLPVCSAVPNTYTEFRCIANGRMYLCIKDWGRDAVCAQVGPALPAEMP